MLNPKYQNKFEKDVKKMQKRGKNINKLKSILLDLINEIVLHPKHRDHALKGNYEHCRECHIEPDWILIYLIKGSSIIFIRTGTHSDLFG